MSADLSWARGGPIPSRRPAPSPPRPPPAALPRAPLPDLDLAITPRAEAPNGEVAEGDDLVVARPRFECPLCSGKVSTYGSVKSGGRRYHRCRSCDLRFQSIEVPLRFLRCPSALRDRLGL